MLTRAIAFSALVSLIAVPSFAQVNMAWNDTGIPGMNTMTFPCDTNEGSHVMVVSFRAPQGFDKLTHLDATIDFCAGGPDLPAWWDVLTCRSGAASVSTHFDGLTSHSDYWQGRGTAGVVFSQPDEEDGRFVVSIDLPENEAGPLVPNEEYYAFRLIIDNRNTVGPAGCVGCDVPICFVLNQVHIVKPGGEDYLYGPIFGYNPQWQGDVLGCPFIVPTRTTTWSAIKCFRE